MDAEKVMQRAMAAYFQYGKAGIPQPSWSSSGVERVRHPRHGLLDYAVLRNMDGVLAAYRIENSGQLRRLKRWPVELETW